MRLSLRKRKLWRSGLKARRQQWRDTPVGPVRLGLLVQWATIKIRISSDVTLRRARLSFNASKDEWRGDAGEGPCSACGRVGPRVWHHIVQLQYGGNNSPNNVVKICPPCHAVIHPHLTMPTTAPIVAAMQKTSLPPPRLVRVRQQT